MSFVNISAAVAKLRAGDVAALPTETVYGLAARIDSEPALAKVFKTKQRPSFDPLIVHVADVNTARGLTSAWPEIYDLLAGKFWPGPLTLIAPKSDRVSTTITSGLTTVAIRCPNHPIFLKAIREVGVPLAAPSANRFGRTSPTTAEHVEEEFVGRVAVVDGGSCSVGLESTVISAERADNKWLIKILRPGGISRQDLSEFLTERKVAFEITRAASLASPGNLKEHYQPVSPIVIVTRTWSDEKLRGYVGSKLGIKISGISELKLPLTPQEAARVLYAGFRRLSKTENHIILITRKREHSGVDWEAVWDRIERAAKLSI